MNNKSTNRRRSGRLRHRLKPVYAAVLLAVSVQTAQANPTGASVVGGNASFATSGNTLTVTNTPGTIINWQGFSINSNEVTRFAQQSAASTVLNRVVGSDPSNIMGTLQSNGRVFLINPNGILFGAGAVVDVAGLMASTLTLSDADFLAGNHHFTEVPGAGNISNAGNISAHDGGQIFLIAPNVENSGVITAPNGEILLAAGHSVDLVSTDNPNLRVNITAPAGDATNVGQLIASSGSLGLFGTMVRNSGVVSADSATMEGGKIMFKASRLAEVGGTVSATGTTGGDIQVLGDQVAVLGNVDASGTNGGGTVLVGGDAHGTNPDVPNAQYTYVDGNATIKADATGNGNGGKVVVWADNATQFSGKISARGGAQSGDGGWVETSGKLSLGFAGLVDTTAVNGLTGSLLLDPTDITISTATNTPTMVWTISTVSYFGDSNASPSNLNVTALQNQLALTNVTVDTASTLPGTGNITVQDSVSWNNGNSLTLIAAGAITVNALTSTSTPLTVNNASTAVTGGLSMTAGGPITIGGGISLAGGSFDVNTPATISMTGALSAGSFILSGGTWKQITSTLPGFSANTGFNILGGTFIRALGGDGSVANPYQLVDIYGVQGIGSAGMLGNAYVLANDIDATVTKNWLDVNGKPVGFAPVGNATVGSFTGQFDGLGHTISNLYIDRAAEDYVGLFGYSAGNVSNVGLLNPIETGGAFYVGGLVGNNTGMIDTSYASNGSVVGNSDVGGLVGWNQNGNISNSFVSNGSVVGSNNVGGLVGNNSGSIINTFSSGGMVSGTYNIGGLVGWNDTSGSISTNYASVSTTLLSGGNYVGGLIGYNAASVGNVSANFWNTTITGAGVSVGVGYDVTAGTGTDIAGGVTGMNDANMKTLKNFNSATAANGNINPDWSISATGSGTIWRITGGITMPLLSYIPVTISVSIPTVIGEIVDITNQQEKPKPEDFLVAEGSLTDENGNPLPMCN